MMETMTNQSEKIVISKEEEGLTVEEYLKKKFDEMILDFRQHANNLATNLRKEFEEGSALLSEKVQSTSTSYFIITATVTSGPHEGNKFRLEPETEDGNDSFKIGRSTGKLFREHGISLYKDKEISTSHGKFEIKNGNVYFIDTRSTNGSYINDVPCEPLMPYRLNDEDILSIGSTLIIINLTKKC